MTASTITFDLAPIMRLEDCQKLHGFLQEHIGTPVTLNCAGVTRLGGMAAQLVAAAAKTWTEDGVGLALTSPSEGFESSLKTLGLENLLTMQEAI